jgi:hypothetical protein
MRRPVTPSMSFRLHRDSLTHREFPACRLFVIEKYEQFQFG